MRHQTDAHELIEMPSYRRPDRDFGCGGSLNDGSSGSIVRHRGVKDNHRSLSWNRDNCLFLDPNEFSKPLIKIEITSL